MAPNMGQNCPKKLKTCSSTVDRLSLKYKSSRKYRAKIAKKQSVTQKKINKFNKTTKQKMSMNFLKKRFLYVKNIHIYCFSQEDILEIDNNNSGKIFLVFIGL